MLHWSKNWATTVFYSPGLHNSWSNFNFQFLSKRTSVTRSTRRWYSAMMPSSSAPSPALCLTLSASSAGWTLRAWIWEHHLAPWVQIILMRPHFSHIQFHASPYVMYVELCSASRNNWIEPFFYNFFLQYFSDKSTFWGWHISWECDRWQRCNIQMLGAELRLGLCDDRVLGGLGGQHSQQPTVR